MTAVENMGTLTSFTFMTLDGYYKGFDEDISWHIHDSEGEKFSQQSLEAGNTLIFGRKTFEMMSGFWPTAQATEAYPLVAEGMNRAKKLVITSAPRLPKWNNTHILNENWVHEIAQLKERENLTLLGSGTILTQLAEVGLIDQFQFMIDPIVIGQGTSIFNGLSCPVNVRLVDTRIFESGKLLLTYRSSPA
jgi:dihydrofolate reductase